ncbi:type III secretion system translocon subunit SctE [Pseudomonas sp. NPDC090202]|uniref:type III secretion system translocon subunit SctE n=1 Tax=unclassified Pseudomonas TaxID=196821 RepID=UPI0038117821
MDGIVSGGSPGFVSRSEGSALKYIDAAGRAGGEQRFLDQAGKALDALLNVNHDSDADEGGRIAGNRPLLMAPGQPPEGKSKDAAARFVELIASIVETLGDAGLKTLESRLDMLKKLSDSARKQNESLSADYQAALAELEAAVADAVNTEAGMEAAQQRLLNARQTLAAAQARLDGLKPGDPDYKAALAARVDVTDAEGLLRAATSVHQSALSVAQAANAKADQLLKSLDAAAPNGQRVLDTQRETNLDAASRLVLLMAKFTELLGDTAENRLEAEKAVAVEIRDAQAAVAKKNAQDYEEQVRKAEALNKAMGCIGKILGAVLTVISVVGAVFTGGASLALAAVGIALTAGDMIGKEITGVSFMEKAMQPLMEHVLSPLVSAIGKAVSSALESIGVSADKAAMIGNVIGAVAGALLMVAAIVVIAVVGKSAAGRIAPKLGEMIGNMTGKIVPDLLKNTSQSASRMFSQLATKLRGAAGLKSDTASLAVYGTRMQQAMAVTEGIGVTVLSTLGAKSGVHQAEAAKNNAGLAIASSIVESMSSWLMDQVENYGDSLNKKFKLIEQLSEEMLRSMSVATSIARNV